MVPPAIVMVNAPGLPAAGIPADLFHVFGLVGLTNGQMARVMAIEDFASATDLGLYDSKEIARVVSDYAKVNAADAYCFWFG